jgi:hypothetical protein
MASGNYGFGTLGALRVLLEQQDLALLPVDVAGEFQLLVEIGVTGRFSCGRPRVIGGIELR